MLRQITVPLIDMGSDLQICRHRLDPGWERSRPIL